MSLTCIVPVKSTSHRLPNKNTKPFFNGQSLLEIKLRQLKQVFESHQILVCGDSKTLSGPVNDLGIRFSHVCCDSENQNLSAYLSKIFRTLTDEDVMVAYVTTPFLNQHVFRQLIETYSTLPADNDSVVAVSRIQVKRLDESGQPLNFGMASEYKGSEDVAPIFSWIRGVSLLPTALAWKTEVDLGYRPFLYQVDRIQAIDIDTLDDWRLARTVANSEHGTELLGLD